MDGGVNRIEVLIPSKEMKIKSEMKKGSSISLLERDEDQ